MPMATAAVAVVTMLLFASWIDTVTAGVIDAPDAAFEGCVPNTSLFAAPGVMLNVPLVAAVRPVLDAPSV
jgi:hypothetical protein